MGKHSSLLQTFVNCGRKKFYNIGSGAHRRRLGLSRIYIGKIQRDNASNSDKRAARQKIGLFLFFVASPKVAKASTIVAVACHCRQRNRLKFNANVNYPLPKAMLRLRMMATKSPNLRVPSFRMYLNMMVLKMDELSWNPTSCSQRQKTFFFIW